MIAVEYHHDLKEVQSDARLATLLSSPCQSAPFDRLEWWQGLAAHCGLRPRLAVARNGEHCAVLPLQDDTRGTVSALANWYTFCFRPVVTPGADGTALLTALASDLAQRCHRLTLSGVPDEDGSASLVESAFRQAGWFVFRAACDSNHVLEPGGRDFAAYLAGRPGSLRTTLRRKGGKVHCDVLTTFDSAAWAEYEDIYAESWKPGEGSAAFLRGFAQEEGAAGRLRLGIARTGDGMAVAAQFWTVEGGTAFIHKLAHRENAKPLSPGTTLSAALFRHVIDEDRVRMIDFGTGDDAYKRDWMEQVRPRYRLTMLRVQHPANWSILAKNLARRLAGKANGG
ncbi:MAG: GNAT family N-acetyltransferase [Novosphingobium sp.]|nr:GNAT family N-acetyltransferase [Novosphingobium sp.]